MSDFDYEPESLQDKDRRVAALRAQLEACQKEKTEALSEVEMDRDFKAHVIKFENDEASVCPEDVGFVEYIGVLTKERDTLLALLREAHDVLSKFDGSPKTRQDWADLRTLAPKLQAALAAHKEPV